MVQKTNNILRTSLGLTGNYYMSVEVQEVGDVLST